MNDDDDWETRTLLTTNTTPPQAPSCTRQAPASSAEDRTMNTWKHIFKNTRRAATTSLRK